jgi:hypothetical protein
MLVRAGVRVKAQPAGGVSKDTPGSSERRDGEREGCAFSRAAHRPNAPASPLHNAFANGEADTGAREFVGMKPVEDAKNTMLYTGSKPIPLSCTSMTHSAPMSRPEM